MNALLEECCLCDNHTDHVFGVTTFCNPCYILHKSTIDPFTEHLRKKNSGIQICYKSIIMPTHSRMGMISMLNDNFEEIDDATLTFMIEEASLKLHNLFGIGKVGIFKLTEHIDFLIKHFQLEHTDPEKAALETQHKFGSALGEASRRKLPIAEHISFRPYVFKKNEIRVELTDKMIKKKARVPLPLPPERYKCYACPQFTLVKKTCECGHSMCDKHFSTQLGKIKCSACAHCLMNELEPLPDDWNIKCDTCKKSVCDKHSNNNGSGQTICAKCNPVLNAKQTASSPPPIASRPKKQVKIDKERQQQMKAEAEAQQASDRLAQIEQLKKKQQEAEARELAQEKFKEEKHPKKRKRGGN